MYYQNSDFEGQGKIQIERNIKSREKMISLPDIISNEKISVKGSTHKFNLREAFLMSSKSTKFPNLKTVRTEVQDMKLISKDMKQN